MIALGHARGYSAPMNMTDIIIYAAVAVFLAFRLWSVLGRREEGEEEKPPRANPFALPEKDNDEDDVVVIEGRAKPAGPSVLTPFGHAPDSLAGALDQIKQADPSFDEKKFIEGAKIAFASIVTTFAAGDLSPVARFLGPSVRGPFEQAIAARRAAGQTLENRVDRIAAMDIIAAKITDRTAQLTVDIVSYQVNILRDAAGQIMDGAPGQAEEVRDVWLFSRALDSADPNWQLVETRS